MKAVVVGALAMIAMLSAAVFVAAANNRTRQARNILLRLRQFALVNLPWGRPTLGHAVGAVVKNRWDVVFCGNFGAGAYIILRFIVMWLIRHSTGRGAEECA